MKVYVVKKGGGKFGTNFRVEGEVFETTRALAKIWTAIKFTDAAPEDAVVGTVIGRDGKVTERPKPFISPTRRVLGPVAEPEPSPEDLADADDADEDDADDSADGNKVGAMSVPNVRPAPTPAPAPAPAPPAPPPPPPMPTADDLKQIEANEKAQAKAANEKAAAKALRTDLDGLDIKALRVEYEKVFGKRPFNGWKSEQLVEMIAEEKAKG